MISRPIRSRQRAERDLAGNAAIATMPSDHAASIGLKPISTRYLVWWTCTAYQIQPPQKKLTASHQKRPVRMARATVHSIAAHSASTMFDGRLLRAAPAATLLAVGQQAEVLGALG